MGRSSGFRRVEERLAGYRGRAARRLMERWADTCSPLGEAGLQAPADIPEWVWGLDPQVADEVLRFLVTSAQAGDEAALLTALVCLRPGLASVARSRARSGVEVEDVVAVAATELLRVRLNNRATVASVVLDVRREMSRRSPRPAPCELLDDPATGAVAAAPAERSAGETLVRLVVDAHRQGVLALDEARLIVETRLLDVPMESAAASRDVKTMTAYRRRWKAERRLVEVAAAA